MRKRLALLAALALVVTACGGSSSDTSDTTGNASSSGNAAAGIEAYNGTCVACHGPNGEGIEGLGKPWVGSDFINSQTDAELLAFLIEGRPSDHPDNTTGIAMMPRGGNPNLTDDDLLNLIAYMRTLNL